MSTVIKHDATSARPVRPRTFELKDHVAQATALVEAARLRSQRMIQQAEAQAEQLREQGARTGYISGHKKGFEEGKRAGHSQAFAEATVMFRQDQEQLAGSLRSLLDEVNVRKRDLLIHARTDVLELAFCIADRITRRMGQLDPHVVMGNVAAACRLTAGKTDLVVRVHPRDAETLRQFSQGWSSTSLDWEHIALVEDESIHRGGCMVSTPDQVIDARLETQLSEIASLLIRDPEALPSAEPVPVQAEILDDPAPEADR